MGLFMKQFRTLVWKNLLLKKRNKRQFLRETVIPVSFILILALIKGFQMLNPLPAVNLFPSYPLKNTSGDFDFSRKILVAPNNSHAHRIATSSINELTDMLGLPEPPQLVFATDADDMYRTYLEDKNVTAGILFQYDSGGNLTYAIRMPYEEVANTEAIYTVRDQCRDGNGLDTTDCDANTYLHSGFCILQTVVDTAIIRDFLEDDMVPRPEIAVQMMPKSKYQKNTIALQVVSAIFFVIGYSQIVNFLCVNIVAEKEKKITDSMKIIGVTDAAIWFSWAFVYFFIIVLITVIVIGVTVLIQLFSNSNILILFLILVIYGTSEIAISCMMSQYLNKAQEGGGFAALITIVVSLLYLIISLTRTMSSTGVVTYSISPFVRCLLCLFSPAAFALVIDQAVYLDVTKGLTYDTFREEGDLPMYWPVLMMIIDTVLYILIAIYTKYFVPENIRLQISSWLCREKTKKDNVSRNDNPGSKGNYSDYVEEVSKETKEKTAIEISGLTKIFETKDGGTEIALKDFTLEMYQGQITCFLGHNGAGKTTLINILCGLMKPTKGSVSVFGYDVTSKFDIPKIRTKTGVCAQGNILFDDLTCAEHLTLYAGLKGMTGKEVSDKVTNALSDVGLEDQANMFANTLSGGQKRKLSIAIALIGDPKILILDEPTAGMDPHSRRQIWRLLKQKKEEKVILLTTHFMDEADILAERKAIMSNGRLQCCGSSIFLKKKFGTGCHLNMLVNTGCDSNKVTEILRRFVPGATLQRCFDRELSYGLPLDDISRFSELFAELEKPVSGSLTTSESLGIKSYGVSMTTLEELFLKLDEDRRIKDDEPKGNNSSKANHTEVSASKPKSDWGHETNSVNVTSVNDFQVSQRNLKYRQFWELCKLRFLRTIRNKILFLFIYLLMPVLFVLTGILINKFSQEPSSMKAKPLNTTHTMGYYARINDTSVPDIIPPLLVIDSAESFLSTVWVEEVTSYCHIDTFPNHSEALGKVPHSVGIDLMSFEFSGFNVDMGYTVLYNTTAVHALPVMINFLSNSLLRTETVIRDMTSRLINTISLPWPKEDTNYMDVTVAFSSTLIIATAFVIIAPGCAVDLVKDRQMHCRAQLRIVGVPSSVYWASNFVVDIIKQYIPGVLTIIIILAVQVDSLSNIGAIISLVLIFITYIPASTMFAYVLSFFFSKFDVCQSVLPVSFLSMGLMPFLAISLLDLFWGPNIAARLHYVMCVIDCPYTIFGSMYYIDRVYRQHGSKVPSEIYFRSESLISITYIMSAFHMCLFVVLLRVLDTRYLGGSLYDVFPFDKLRNLRKEKGLSKDNGFSADRREMEDVADERERVQLMKRQSESNCPIVLVEDLRKEFSIKEKSSRLRVCNAKPMKKSFVAVDNLSLAIEPGEVFGLLGPNGAGKSTTINMMTANTKPTSGTVIVGGHNIDSSASLAFKIIGYCPQHDALWDSITLKEHLSFYANVRGIEQHQIDEAVEIFLQMLRLEDHYNKYPDKLSGGTKRKLSYAIAMLGNPKTVLLDEPSTGMDPTSKRFFWDTISKCFTGSDRGALLTTHSMEEADALCSRIGIMVNGKLECIGSSQQLKNKYGTGYYLEVKLKDVDEKEGMKCLDQYIISLFPYATRLERFGTRAQYKIPRENCKSLAKIFSVLEQGKSKHNIEEYSFSQSTLEQVFLTFAKKQRHEEEPLIADNDHYSDSDRTTDV